MCLSVGYYLQILKIGIAQQTIDQKLTLIHFDQLCVNQIYLTTLRYQLHSFMVPPIEKFLNALIYQSIY